VISQDHAGYANNFFFLYYICLPKEPDVQHGFMECLYPIWMRSDASSPLRPIVTAVAGVMLDAWSQIKPDLPNSLSRAHYGQGVEALRRRLQGTDDAGDDIIMAALMLVMYENLTSFLTGQRNRGPHMTGTTAMIESRRQQPFADEVSQRLILGARNQVVGRAISSAESVPTVVSNWSERTTGIPTTPYFKLDSLKIEVANLQADALRLTQIPETPDGEIVAILNWATELDEQFSIWSASLPPDWPPTRVSGPERIPQSVREAGLYQDYCDIYRSVFVANTFNSYYKSRIVLQMVIIACLERLNSEATSLTTADFLLSIQDLADTLCASIPFLLGDRVDASRLDDTRVRFPSIPGRSLPASHYSTSGAFGGFLLCIQLVELLPPRVPLRPGQKQWIGGQLGRIKRWAP